MFILTRYLLRAHLGPFLFALGTLTGLLLVNSVAKQLEDLAGKGLGFLVMGEVFLLMLPHVVALSLPMAVLVAVLYTFAQLAADNEITALRSSGVHVAKLLLPLVAVAGVLTATMIWFNDRVLPETNHQLKQLLVDITRKAPMLQLEEQVINEIPSQDLRTRYYLQAGRIDQATNRLRDIVIYDVSDPARERRIYADSGQMSFSEDQTDLYLVLYHGRVQDLAPGEPDRFQRLFFEKQLLRMAGVGSQFERSYDAGFRSDREMSLGALASEIADGRRQLEELRDQVAAQALDAVRQTLWPEGTAPPGEGGPVGEEAAGGSGVRRTSVLATAAVGGGRLAGAAPTELPAPGRAAQAPPAMAQHDALTSRTAVELRSHQYRADMFEFRINSYAVEYHKKYAIPFACMVFVLLGAPVAIRFPRGGVGMVIAFSLVVFSIYYVALIGGEKLGDQGKVAPALAMWLPNLVLLVLGLFGLKRISKISGSTRGGGWDDLRHMLVPPFFAKLIEKRRNPLPAPAHGRGDVV